MIKQKKEENIVDFPGGLDPAQFRVTGTDTKGHTQRIWVNVQPMHAQMLDVMAQSGKFPYRNRGDLLRHALVRHFHWLERIHQPLNSVTGALDAMNALLRENEFRMEFKDYVTRLTKQIEQLVDEGDIVAARKLLLETLRNIESMPDGYWKDKYSTEVRKRNKDILTNLPKANLLSFDGGEE